MGTWCSPARATGRVPAFRRAAALRLSRDGEASSPPRQRCRSRAGMQAGAASVPLLQVSARAVRARGARARSSTWCNGCRKPAAAGRAPPARCGRSRSFWRGRAGCRSARNPSAVQFFSTRFCVDSIYSIISFKMQLSAKRNLRPEKQRLALTAQKK